MRLFLSLLLSLPLRFCAATPVEYTNSLEGSFTIVSPYVEDCDYVFTTISDPYEADVKLGDVRRVGAVYVNVRGAFRGETYALDRRQPHNGMMSEMLVVVNGNVVAFISAGYCFYNCIDPERESGRTTCRCSWSCEGKYSERTESSET